MFAKVCSPLWKSLLPVLGGDQKTVPSRIPCKAALPSRVNQRQRLALVPVQPALGHGTTERVRTPAQLSWPVSTVQGNENKSRLRKEGPVLAPGTDFLADC